MLQKLKIASFAAIALAILVTSLAIPGTASAERTGKPTIKPACAPRTAGSRTNVSRAILVPYRKHESGSPDGTVTLYLNDCFDNIDADTVFLAYTSSLTAPGLMFISPQPVKAVSAVLPAGITEASGDDSAPPASGVNLDGTLSGIYGFAGDFPRRTFKYKGNDMRIILRTDVPLGNTFPVGDTLYVKAFNGDDESDLLRQEMLPQIKRDKAEIATAAFAMSDDTNSWPVGTKRTVTLTSGLPIGDTSNFRRFLCISGSDSCDPAFPLASDTDKSYPEETGKSHTVKYLTGDDKMQSYGITRLNTRVDVPTYLRFKLEPRSPASSTSAYIMEGGMARLVTGADIGTQTLTVAIGVASEPTAVFSIAGGPASAGAAARVPYTETSGVTNAIALSSAGSQNLGNNPAYCWTLAHGGAGTAPANLGTLTSTSSSGSCKSTDATATYTPPNQKADLTVTIGLAITPTTGESAVMASRALTVDRSRQATAVTSTMMNSACSIGHRREHRIQQAQHVVGGRGTGSGPVGLSGEHRSIHRVRVDCASGQRPRCGRPCSFRKGSPSRQPALVKRRGRR